MKFIKYFLISFFMLIFTGCQENKRPEEYQEEMKQRFETVCKATEISYSGHSYLIFHTYEHNIVGVVHNPDCKADSVKQEIKLTDEQVLMNSFINLLNTPNYYGTRHHKNHRHY